MMRRLAAVAAAIAILGGLVDASAVRADDPAPLRIVALGDSIAEGYDSQTGTYTVGFRDMLSGRLTAAGIPNTVINEGHGGETIAQVAARVDTMMAVDQPDIVLVYVGTNDCRGAPDVPGGASNPVALAGGKLAALIDRILADSPTVRAVLATLILSGPQWPQINEQTLNPAIVALTKSRPRTTLADMSPISNVYLADGYHPGVIGYAMMAYLWYEAMRKIIPSMPDASSVLTGQFPSHIWSASYTRS